MTDRQQIDAEMNGCIDALKVTSPCVTPERMDVWVLKSPEQLACASEEDAEMERDIQALGLTAPRVTPEQIDALMRGVRYEVQVVTGTTTTLATAIAANGFTLAIGMTACADPANFNAEFGAKYAIKDAEAKARQELWKLEGWRLKCHLANL